jgi:hypothetical protein
MLSICDVYMWWLDGHNDNLYWKTNAKALDINNIIKKLYGDVSAMSPNLLMNNQIQPPIKIWK